MFDREPNDDVRDFRKADHEVPAFYLNRWSPRAFRPDPVPEEDLLACFEAARWAPSAYNEQPWRFVYARTDEDRAKFASCLIEFNRAWAPMAPVLIALCAKEFFSHEDAANAHHAFDAGAAWASFALEATRRGYHCHAMAGFDADKARSVLGVPEGFRVVCFFVMGKKGPADLLPEGMQKTEAPSGRRPVAESAAEGAFPPEWGS